MLFKWNYKPPTKEEKQAADELGAKLNISPILAQLLMQRGITTESAAKRFFHPQLADLINPFLMKDMDLAVDRLNDAMGRKERILVYGDYDVDGCTAVALVYKFIQQFYSNIEYYIPDRYDEGYGVSKKGIDYAKEAGVKLIIILDCGIKAVEEIAYAKSLGIDFIICDHHMPDEELPPAVAILNPKRPDDTYPFKHLCGCGVGFKLMQAFAKNNGIPFARLIPLLDFCAVSIAADIVPVTEENRILAYHGLKTLNQNPSIGLKAIIDICGLGGRDISMSDIVFKIGPRINASGRMENGRESVDLLVEKDFSHALAKAKHIDEYNEQRKDIDKQMTEEANSIVSKLESQRHRSSIVLYDENWKKGVIGNQELPRPARQLRRTYIRSRTDAALGRYPGVPQPLPAICRRAHTARTDRGDAQHRRRNRLPRHNEETAQRPEKVLTVRTRQHQAALLHDRRIRLRHEQGCRTRAGAHKA